MQAPNNQFNFGFFPTPKRAVPSPPVNAEGFYPPPRPPVYSFFDQLVQLVHRINIQQMSFQFDQLDANQNGVLEEQEIRNTQNSPFSLVSFTSQVLAQDEHELMFANIDPGNAAWHGLTRNDLNNIQSHLAQGNRLEDYGNQLRQEISAQRGVPGDELGFEQWVEEQRARIPNPGDPVEPGPLPRTDVMTPKGENSPVNNVKSLMPRHLFQNGAINLVQETSGKPTEYTVQENGQVTHILFPSGDAGNRDTVSVDENGVLQAGGGLGTGKYFNRIGDQLVFVDPDFINATDEERASMVTENVNANKVSIFTFRPGEGIVHFQTTLSGTETLEDAIARVNANADQAIAAELD